ncbi:MAG: carbohydrate kinase family protein [Gammaproteobacteria bacterium]
MNDNCLIHLFGEVLFDHFPDGSRVLGGAPFNVAWHLQAFGQSPRFISRIGNDPPGREIADLMDSWGLSRDALQTDAEHPTGSVRVRIENNEPSYEIVNDCAYDFIAPEQLDPNPTQGIFYHGSLAIRNPASRAALECAKALHQGTVFVDVNLRPPWWHRETLLPLLHDAGWIKLNEAELAELCPGHDNLESAMKAFAAEFGLETLVVTRGAKGAIACDRQQRFTAVEPRIGTEIVDTVGAGDAFASVLLLGIARQWPLAIIMDRAQDFASALVGRRGATVHDQAFYSAFGERWSDN